MNSSVIAGLIGGFVSVALCTYISQKVRNSTIEGQLRFGWFINALGWGCTCFVGLAVFGFFYDKNAWEEPSELLSIVGLFVGFGVGAIYCFGEAFKVEGKFDYESITFHTPWTGTKVEKWDDLVSINFNSIGNWYVLSFESGKRIRLSKLLNGYGDVLKLLREKGHIFIEY